MKRLEKVSAYKDAGSDMFQIGLPEDLQPLVAELCEKAAKVGDAVKQQASNDQEAKFKAEIARGKQLLKDLPDPAKPESQAGFVKMMSCQSKKKPNATSLDAAQNELSKIVSAGRKEAGDGELPGYAKEAEGLIADMKGTISTYAMLAVMLNPIAKQDSDEGQQFRKDLLNVTNYAKENQLVVPKVVMEQACVT